MLPQIVSSLKKPPTALLILCRAGGADGLSLADPARREAHLYPSIPLFIFMFMFHSMFFLQPWHGFQVALMQRFVLLILNRITMDDQNFPNGLLRIKTDAEKAEISTSEAEQ